MARQKTILSVAAHPDDETLSYGALLQRAREFKWKIHFIWATNGEGSTSTQATARRQEAECLAKLLRADAHFFDMKDGELDLGKLIQDIDEVVKLVNPDLVLWPHGQEENQHQDHREIHAAMLNIAQRSVLGCSWLSGQPPVDMDRFFAPRNFHFAFGEALLTEKYHLMDVYTSEASKQFASKDFLKSKALQWRYDGRLYDRHYAEPFTIHRLGAATIIEDLRYYPLDILNHVEALADALSETARADFDVWAECLRIEGPGLADPLLLGRSGQLAAGYAGSSVVLYAQHEGTFALLHLIDWQGKTDPKGPEEIPESDRTVALARFQAYKDN